MPIYQEMVEDYCGFCARPAVFVRVVSAFSPWLYNVAGSWLAATSRHAWMSGASVLISWECLDCGCKLSDRIGAENRTAPSMDSPTLPAPQLAPLSERPGAR